MLYSYRCKKCKRETDAINKVDDRHTNAPECHGKMELFISQAPYGYVTMDIRYRCPVTKQGVTSLRQRNDILDRHNLMDANDFVTDAAIARTQKKHDDLQEFCKKHKPPEVEKYVDKWVATL